MFDALTRKLTIGAVVMLAALPLMAQTPAEQWRAYAEAMRDWGRQMRESRFAFQAHPAPPSPPAPPVAVAINMSRSFLGVHVVEVDSKRADALKLKDEVGVEITGVEPDSPAEKGGLKVGDVVLEYQGQRVEGTEQFIRLVRETPVGRQVKMLVHRQGTAPQTVTAVVGVRKNRAFAEGGLPPRLEAWMPDLPRAYSGWRSPRFGVEAEGLDGQLAEFFGVKEGVLIRSVMKGSVAEKGGFKAGDVITKVDQQPLDSPQELSELLRNNRDKKTVTVTVVRDKREMTLNANLEAERGERSAPARTVRRGELQF